VSRWATLSAFFRDRLPEVQARRAGTAAGIADEPATHAMLEAFVRRAAALGIDTGPIDTGPIDTGPIDTGPIGTGPADTGQPTGRTAP
jgi:hypothetical protein